MNWKTKRKLEQERLRQQSEAQAAKLDALKAKRKADQVELEKLEAKYQMQKYDLTQNKDYQDSYQFLEKLYAEEKAKHLAGGGTSWQLTDDGVLEKVQEYPPLSELIAYGTYGTYGGTGTPKTYGGIRTLIQEPATPPAPPVPVGKTLDELFAEDEDD